MLSVFRIYTPENRPTLGSARGVKLHGSDPSDTALLSPLFLPPGPWSSFFSFSFFPSVYMGRQKDPLFPPGQTAKGEERKRMLLINWAVFTF